LISSVHRQKTGYFPAQKFPPVRRRVFRFSRNKLPALVIIILLLYLIISFSLQFNKLYAMQGELRQVQKQVAELQINNAQLRDQLKLVQSDSYIEQMAREKLGLVKPGESRIITVEPGKKQ
jgi:cell division protein FtsL